MENDQLEQQILQELQCPICLEYITPPIGQCIRGHTLCSKCVDKSRNCQTCGAPRSSARCFLLETIYSDINFPCKNTDHGCSYRNKGRVDKDHEKMCEYVPWECPFNVDDYCVWQGPTADILAHCKQKHERELFISSYHVFGVNNFKNVDDGYNCYVFFAHGHFFRFLWEVETDGECKEVKFVLHHFGNKEDSERFSYVVKFGVNQRKSFTMRLKCKPYCKGKFVLDCDSWFVTNLSSISKYCDEDGMLKIFIKIKN